MNSLYEIKGFSVVLTKVVLVSPVFTNEDQQIQFNIRLDGDSVLKLRYEDRPQATLERDLFLKALKNI